MSLDVELEGGIFQEADSPFSASCPDFELSVSDVARELMELMVEQMVLLQEVKLKGILHKVVCHFYCLLALILNNLCIMLQEIR
jgi:hypothetical protein